jgi:polyisoprenyl-teichoic acid--peptidoglycan teichoic acid transferase
VQTVEKRSEYKKAKKKKRKGLKIFLTILAALILLVGGYVIYAYNQVKHTVDNEMHEKVDSIENEPGKVAKGKESIHILLMGVDEREHDKGRADTLIVLTVNPKTKSMQQISIPRDTYVEIVGHGTHDKINHSYAFGGTDMTIATVEKWLDIDLDYYVKINMEGLSQLVDAMGGITVDNPIEWTDSGKDGGIPGYHYALGEIELDGDNVMGFVRMRKQDPQGDVGRNLRQRLVIESLVKKGASVGTVTKLGDILDVLGTNVSTNMSFDEMKSIFKNYRQAASKNESYQIEGSGEYLGTVWYFMVSEEERQKLHDMIVDFAEAK